MQVKPRLNVANHVDLVREVRRIGKKSANLFRSDLVELSLREPGSGVLTNCDEAVFKVHKRFARHALGTSYSSTSANLASDWFKLESSPVEKEETRTAVS